MKKLFMILIALALVGCENKPRVVTNFIPDLSSVERAENAEAELKKIRDKEASDEKLGQYAINMMHRTKAGSALSDGKKLVLARAIVRVANDIFEKEEHKRGFVAAISIESEFQRFAQSPTGPKGYAQLAKRSFHEAMTDCGVSVSDDDVWETDLNLYAGACYFRKILDMPDVNGDPFVAIVGYNQGPNSKDMKMYSRYGSMDGIEPLKYVAKFTFLTNTTTHDVPPGVPAISELPKPTPNATVKTEVKEVKAKAK